MTLTKYYKNRLWKITQMEKPLGKTPAHGVKYIKIYERRKSVGLPWQFVRGKNTIKGKEVLAGNFQYCVADMPVKY